MRAHVTLMTAVTALLLTSCESDTPYAVGTKRTRPPGVDSRVHFALGNHFLIASPPPHYPAEAKARHIEGTAVMRLRVRSDGTVEAVTLLRSSGSSLLDAEAKRSFLNWRFTPESKPFTADLPCDFYFSKHPPPNSVRLREA
jgi:TonB family protein